MSLLTLIVLFTPALAGAGGGIGLSALILVAPVLPAILGRI